MNNPSIRIHMALKTALIVFVSSLLISCGGTQARLNEVSLGMSKTDVIDVMGQPASSAASDGFEYMIYELSRRTGTGQTAGCTALALLTLGITLVSPACRAAQDDFFVRFVDGEVESYGRVGDFDSTQVPEATINVNRND